MLPTGVKGMGAEMRFQTFGTTVSERVWAPAEWFNSWSITDRSGPFSYSKSLGGDTTDASLTLL